MRYLKPIDLWVHGAAVRSGQIRLQSGQWVRCGADGPLSRFHSVRSTGSIWAIHGPDANSKYLQLCAEMREEQARLEARRQARAG